MKECTVCKKDRSLDLFYRDKRAKDGRYSCCKDCMNKKNEEWRLRNPEKVKILKDLSHKKHREKEREYAREYARTLRKENYEKYRKNKDEWDLKNPEKVKEIRKKAHKKHYEKNYEKLYEQAEKWRKENPEKLKEYQRRASKLARRRYPEKDKARKFLHFAVKLGYKIRPSNCSRCLRECKPEGHHEDYSKPLEVEWVCRACHNGIHGKQYASTRTDCP